MLRKSMKKPKLSKKALESNKNYQALYKMLSKKPPLKEKKSMAKWFKLGPVDIEEWIMSGKIEFNEELIIDARYDYIGQNRQNGIGRETYAQKEVYEGSFKHG